MGRREEKTLYAFSFAAFSCIINDTVKGWKIRHPALPLFLIEEEGGRFYVEDRGCKEVI